MSPWNCFCWIVGCVGAKISETSIVLFPNIDDGVAEFVAENKGSVKNRRRDDPRI